MWKIWWLHAKCCSIVHHLYPDNTEPDVPHFDMSLIIYVVSFIKKFCNSSTSSDISHFTQSKVNLSKHLLQYLHYFWSYAEKSGYDLCNTLNFWLNKWMNCSSVIFICFYISDFSILSHYFRTSQDTVKNFSSKLNHSIV